jgi:hypothetical protein
MKEYNISISLDDNQDALLNQITDIYNQCMDKDSTPEATLKFVLMMCANDIDRTMEFLKTNFSHQLKKKNLETKAQA